MADAGNIIVNINADDSGLTAALKRASNRIATFGHAINGRITEGLVDPTQKAKFEFKDVSRIVAGIMVSKVFYGGLNAIRNATSAVREFCTELEYTQTAFSQLFGSTELAAEFVNVLKDFSAVSPFSFSESSKAAQRLLAYGIEYKNIMYVMQGVLDAATMQGDASKIESISRALGQIYTKGTLKAEEIRQLAEAGIPAYDILREKLQLTDEAMQKLGQQGIPASVAINALVDGIHERFAGMTKDSAKTMKGMWSNIKDNMLMMMQGFFEPLYNDIRNVTHMLDTFINKLREIADIKGLGGVFEYLVPDKTQQAEFRQFVALIKELGQIIGYTLKSALIACREVAYEFVQVFNMLAPALVNVGQILSMVMRLLAQCKPLMAALAYALAFNVGAWAAFRTAALGAMILGPVTKLIMGCAKALAILAGVIYAHPLVAGIILLSGAVAALGISHSKAGAQIKDFFTQLTKWNGIDPGKQLLPETKKRTADINKFNEKLDTTKDALDATGDAAEKAAKKGKKAQKDLLSFDEVFRLTEKDGAGKDAITTPNWSIPDGGFGDWDNLDADSMVPDFGELAGGAFERQLDKLESTIKGLWDKFKDKLPGILSGAGLGTLLGNLIGGPLGGLIGGLAGAVAGHFWNELANVIGIHDKWDAAIASALLGGIMGLIASLVGLPGWAVALAGFAGFFGGLFWEKVAEAFGLEGAKKVEAAIASAIGTAFGAIIGGLIGGPVGAVIGAAAGTFAGEFWSIIADKIGLGTGSKFAGLIAGGIAATIGAALSNTVLNGTLASFAPKLTSALTNLFSGATAGAGGTILNLPTGGFVLNTASIASLAATWISTFVEGIQTGDWSGLIPAVTGTIGHVLLGPIGGIAGVIAGDFYNATYEALKEKFGLSSTDKIKDVFVAAFEGLVSGFTSWMIPIITPLGTSLGTVVQSTITNGLKGGIAGIITSLISSALSNKLLSILGEAFNLTDSDIKAGKTGQQIGGICGSIIGGIAGFFFGGPAGAAIGSIIGNGLGQPLGTAIGGLWSTQIAPALDSLFANISTFFTVTIPAAWSDFTANLSAAWSDFVSWITSAWSGFTTWVSSIPESISAFFVNVTNGIAYWLGYALGSIVRFFTQTIPDAWNSFTDWVVGISQSISEWCDGIANSLDIFLTETLPSLFIEFFTQTLPTAWNDFWTWASGIPGLISEALTAIWQTITQTLSTIWMTVTEFVGNIVTSLTVFFTQTIPAAWNDFWAWVSSIPGQLSQYFTDLYNDFTEWGANLIQGFRDGISQAWSDFTDWVGGLIDNFIAGFKDGLGIHSPSTVFYDIGANAILGLINGTEFTWQTLTGFAGALIDTLTGLFTSGFDLLSTTAANFITNATSSITDWISTTKGGLTEWLSTTKSTFVDWFTTTGSGIASWATTAKQNIRDWTTNAFNDIRSFVTQGLQNINNFVTQGIARITNFASNSISRFSSWASQTIGNISSWSARAISIASSWASNFAARVQQGCTNAMSKIGNFISNATSRLNSWASSMASKISSVLSSAASAASSALSSAGSAISRTLSGHATGGIFNREHVARISEGNKAEAIIPLEDKAAMQPFVDAVSSGLAQYLGPVLANMQAQPAYATNDSTPPLYVGTLIADERGLKELERKMRIIQLKEDRRRS